MAQTPLVLIPGLGCTGKLFAPQIEELAMLGPLSILDHRQDDSMAAIARRFLAEAPGEFALAGLSLGGYIAFEIVRQAPERVTALALLDTSALADTPERIKLRQTLAERTARGELMAIAAELYPGYVHSARREDDALRDVYFSMMRDTGAPAFRRQLAAIAGRADSTSLLSSIEVPTIVVVGAEDEATPVARARDMADAIPHARLEIVPDCGHLSTLEKPRTLSRILSEWRRAIV